MNTSQYQLKIKTNMNTLAQHTNGVIESHSFDIKGREDGFLVGEGGVIVARHFSRQDTTHVAQIHVNGTQICSA